MAIDQRMLAEYLRKQQQQGMSLGRPPITMESQVNALANQPVAPGMVGAYVDQSKPDPRAKSFTGEENRIKSQRAMANMLRGKEAPKGKTVGPYDLYMGPNWGESLAYAGEQALGGYMAGKANRDDIELDEERGLVKAAELAAEDAKDERDFNLKLDTFNRGIFESDRSYDYDKERNEMLDQLEAEKLKYDRAIAEAETEEEKAERIEDKRRWELDYGIKYEELLLAQEEANAKGTYADKFDEATNKAINALGSAKERDAARMLLSTSQELQRLTNEAGLLLKESPDSNWSSLGADISADVASGFPLIGGDALRNVVKSKAYSEGEKKIRGMASNAVESFRRARTGANLTGVEIKVGEDWDPTAPAIGAEESLRRTIELNRVINSYLGNMGIPQPSGNKSGDGVASGNKSDEGVEKQWEDDEYFYRELPDGTVQRRKKG